MKKLRLLALRQDIISPNFNQRPKSGFMQQITTGFFLNYQAKTAVKSLASLRMNDDYLGSFGIWEFVHK